ncbi:MAG: dTDP-4-dehydrorhamnose 3,5-epimerase family protein [bacterium]|nr:dTDP-4-dehydrorhamnose 3,5-epimerase family protein [bacterium]
MKRIETEIAGVVTIELDSHRDERGAFTRIFDALEVGDRTGQGFEQWSIADNDRRGTLRGLHFQAEPHGETKLVMCVRGSAMDVAVDLRPSSPTYLRHVAVTLRGDHPVWVCIPPGCAHGYQTLEAHTRLLYAIAGRYVPDAARGINHRDPRLAIAWPLEVAAISDRDASWPFVED